MTKYVLSLDGGGVRGLASANFLRKLEYEMHKPLLEKFDLVCGSSTGGILAIALSVLKLNGSRLVNIYSSRNLKRIFSSSMPRLVGPKYGDRRKNNVLREYFGSLTLNEADTPAIAVSYDLKKRSTRLFKTFEDKHLKAWKVASATSAAPTFFPAVKIEENWYIDGAISSNNPVLIAYAEAKKLWPDENIKVLSIGTGFDSKSFKGSSTKNWGIFSWLRGGIIQVLMESNSEHLIAESLFKENYLRINSELNKVHSDIDNSSDKNLEECLNMGDQWWQEFGSQTLDFLITN